MSKAHPGFDKVAATVARRQGVSLDRAAAMVAAGAQKTSPQAKARNPRLKKVSTPNHGSGHRQGQRGAMSMNARGC